MNEALYAWGSHCPVRLRLAIGPQVRRKRQEQDKNRLKTAVVKSPRRPHAVQRAHQHAEIETGGMNQQSLEDVVVPAQVHPSHASFSFLDLNTGKVETVSDDLLRRADDSAD